MGEVISCREQASSCKVPASSAGVAGVFLASSLLLQSRRRVLLLPARGFRESGIPESQSCLIKWPHDKCWSPCPFLLETRFWHGDLFRMFSWCSLCFGFQNKEFIKSCNRGSWASVGICCSLVYCCLLSQIPVPILKASPLHNSYSCFARSIENQLPL